MCFCVCIAISFKHGKIVPSVAYNISRYFMVYSRLWEHVVIICYLEFKKCCDIFLYVCIYQHILCCCLL